MSDIREGRWLCSSCGSECRGRDERCNGEDGHSGCGSPRPAGTRFYLPENSPYVTEAGLLADAMSGVDWNCGHCGGANKGSRSGRRVVSCVHCGNSRDRADKDTPIRLYERGSAPKTPGETAEAERSAKILASRARRTDRLNAEAGSAFTSKTKASRFGMKTLGAVTAAVLLLAFGIWSLFLARYEISLDVSSREWTRVIEIEQYRTLRQEGWEPPEDARILARDRRVRSYLDIVDHYRTVSYQVPEQVAAGTESYSCGTEDMGNGYFRDRTCTRTRYETRNRTETRQEPVYRKEPVHDTWYGWEVDRWVHDREFTARGTDEQRAWPELPELGQDRREASRHEVLMVTLTGPEDLSVARTETEADWLGMGPGSSILATTDFWGRIVGLDLPSGRTPAGLTDF